MNYFTVGDDVMFRMENHVLRGTIISLAGIFAKVKIHTGHPSMSGQTQLVELSSLSHWEKPDRNIKNNSSATGTAKSATHYQKAAMQPIEMMQRFLTRAEFIGFLKGNIIKYTARAGYKGNRAEDTQKARQYAYWLAMAQAGIVIQAEHDSVPNDFHMKTTFDIEHNYSDAQLICGEKKR